MSGSGGTDPWGLHLDWTQIKRFTNKQLEAAANVQAVRNEVRALFGLPAQPVSPDSDYRIPRASELPSPRLRGEYRELLRHLERAAEKFSDAQEESEEALHERLQEIERAGVNPVTAREFMKDKFHSFHDEWVSGLVTKHADAYNFAADQWHQHEHGRILADVHPDAPREAVDRASHLARLYGRARFAMDPARVAARLPPPHVGIHGAQVNLESMAAQGAPLQQQLREHIDSTNNSMAQREQDERARHMNNAFNGMFERTGRLPPMPTEIWDHEAELARGRGQQPRVPRPPSEHE